MNAVVIEFGFVDSWADQKPEPDNTLYLTELLYAANHLRDAVRTGSIPVLSLSPSCRSVSRDLPDVITYCVKETELHMHRSVVSKATFNVSHVIGSYAVTTKTGKVVRINIEPRWGAGLLSYLLCYAADIWLPAGPTGSVAIGPDKAAWVLMLLWKLYFEQTIRRLHVPKQYRERKVNGPVFKGRLDAPRQLRENAVDQSRFACIYSPLTADTTINRTIRCAYRLLSKNPVYAKWLTGVAGYDRRLQSLGVGNDEVRPAEIDRIVYTPLSAGYKQLMQTSKAIIGRFGASNTGYLEGGSSYLIDVATLWENFLAAVLRRGMRPDFRVINPNESGGYFLFDGLKREIRPDLVIEDCNGEVVAIIDAKFKRYTIIGNTAQEGIQRHDLYQMTTYMYHFGIEGRPLLGLFICPTKAESGEVARLRHRSSHAIGVLGFDIEQWANPLNIQEVRENEQKFAGEVKQLIQKNLFNGA